MKTDYKKAESRKEKIEIQANTSAETAKFWNYTEEVHLLKIDTIETVLPKLDRLRKSARQGILGRIEKQINDPEFRKEAKILYANLSTMALSLDNPGLKKEISEILKNNDRLYRKNRKGLSAYNNIIKIIDKITERFHSEYAKSRQALRIIQRKKKETEMTIEAIKYSLSLQPLQAGMLDINLDEAFSDVPEIELDELLLIDNEQNESGANTSYYNDPDIDKSLERFQDQQFSLSA